MLLRLSALLSVLLQFHSIAADEIDFETLSSLPPEERINFAKSPLAKRYQLSAHLKPFYLHGDFDGDGQRNTAFVLKERATEKSNTSIYHGQANRLVIVDAGRDWGNGSDGFPGLNAWHVFRHGPVGQGVANGRKPPKLCGDAIVGIKTEAASALIC